MNLQLNKSLFIILLFSINILNAIDTIPSVSVNLAVDSYLSSKEFINKYSTSKDTVSTAIYNNVRFFIIEDSQNIFIVVRGTQNKENIKTDISIKHKNITSDIKVHQGFYDVAYGINMLIKNKLKDDKDITLAGHSLGGGVALLLGSMLYDNGYKVKLFTFGSPPVGDKNFVRKYKKLEHYRYEHKYDFIPKMNQKTISIIKKGLNKLNNNIEDIQRLKNILYIVSNTKYDFIHHGHKIILKNKAITPNYIQDKSIVLKIALKPLFFHSVLTYNNGINKVFKN